MTFKVGDKVRLTGWGWGDERGTVVVVESLSAEGYGEFSIWPDQCYVTPTELHKWGAVVVEAAE